MKEVEQIDSLYAEACALKDIARKSIDKLEHFIKAAEYLHKVAHLSTELALKSEHDIDLKIQAELFSLYYSYEEHDCLASYFYEKHETETAKSHLRKSNSYISKAISLIESLPESISPEARRGLIKLLPNYKYRCLSNGVRMTANDARAAWDNGHLIEALDFYRSMAARQEKIIAYLEEHDLSPIFQRIEKSNFITLMVNTSATMARITIENNAKDDQDILQLPYDLFAQLLKYTADAYYLGMAAYKQNPEWQQSRTIALQCLQYLQSLLTMNESAWPKLYIEFEDDPNFLKLMKMTDIDKFKEVETKRHLKENKLLKLWVVGSFWLFVLILVVAVVLIIQSYNQAWWRLLLVIGAVEVILVIVGAFTLRTIGDLSEKNFLDLVGMAFKYQFNFFKLLKKERDK